VGPLRKRDTNAIASQHRDGIESCRRRSPAPRATRSQCPATLCKLGDKRWSKLIGFAALAVLAAIMAASPTSAHLHRRAAAARGHTAAASIDPNGLYPFARLPGDPPGRATTQAWATISVSEEWGLHQPCPLFARFRHAIVSTICRKLTDWADVRAAVPRAELCSTRERDFTPEQSGLGRAK